MNSYLQKEVKRLEGLLEQWEYGRDWWECALCGNRFHGRAEDAPFHDKDDEPLCDCHREG